MRFQFERGARYRFLMTENVDLAGTVVDFGPGWVRLSGVELLPPPGAVVQDVMEIAADRWIGLAQVTMFWSAAAEAPVEDGA